MSEETKVAEKPKAEAKPAQGQEKQAQEKKAAEPKDPPKVPGTDLSRQVGADVPALRKERAKRIKKMQETEEQKDTDKLDEAKKVGMHVAKLDDVGAAEQQKAARDNRDATLIDDLEGAPIVAPVLEESEGSIKIVSRRESDSADFEEGTDYMTVDGSARFVGYNLHILGEGFLFPGEVIIDIHREGDYGSTRFSTWTTDGRIDCPLPGIVGVGDYEVRAEQLVTQVGEGRDDRLPLIKETETVPIEMY